MGVGPTVSVVVIFRDAEAFLDEAIDSVRAQTYPHWELLLVDDGSTDASSSIAARAAAEEPNRIRHLWHPGRENRGMSASRNLGIARAAGELVAFLDADDVYLPEKLEHQVALLAAHPEVDLVYGPRTYWWGWTGDPADVGRDRVSPLRVPVGQVLDPPALFVRYLRGQARTPATCSVLVRRDALLAVGGFEESFRGMYEDQVAFCKLALHVRVLATDRPLDRYRQHERSTSARALRSGEWARADPNPATARFEDWLRSYAPEAGPHAAVVTRELRRLRRRRWLRRLRGRR